MSKGRGYFGEVIIRPKETLSENHKHNLALSLTPLTAEGFMRTVTDALYKDVYDHVIDCDRLRIAQDKNGKSVAFIATSLRFYRNMSVYHLEGIITSESVRGNGFAKTFLENDIRECGSDVLAFHTQSFIMRKLGEKISHYDFHMSVEIAELIGTRNLQMSEIGPFDRGRYGGSSLYGDIKKFDSIAIKGNGFDHLRGDAIIFAGYVKES